MFVVLNDGRKVNMTYVLSFYQEGKDVVFDMVKGDGLRIREPFKTEAEAEERVKGLEEEFIN